MASASPGRRDKEGCLPVRVAVVGLSGAGNAECGVGKSCLCNRFVRSAEDEYEEKHFSAIASTDFYGSVINGQHFLYWGKARKYPHSRPSPELSAPHKKSYEFHVVEHTEFVDDSTFKTLSGSSESGIAAYLRRVGKLKLTSSGKLSYINRDQLADIAIGSSSSYEVETFPSPFEVDAFLVAVDVSRILPTQAKWLEKLLQALGKLKRPFVIAACKFDKVLPACMEELGGLVKRHAKGTPIVETSARQAVNVDAAFMALASMMRRSGRHIGIGKSPDGYEEALHEVEEERGKLMTRFRSLLEQEVHDFCVTWPQVEVLLTGREELQQLIYTAGRDAVRHIVIAHVKLLRESRRNEQLRTYKTALKWAFATLLPGVHMNSQFENAMETVRSHSAVSDYLVEVGDEPWDGKELLSNPPEHHRVPMDVLRTPEARQVFEEHIQSVEIARQNAMQANMLMDMMEESKAELLPGSSWSSAWSLLRSTGKSSENLSIKDSVKQQVFSQFDADLRQQCCDEFYDALLLNMDVLEGPIGNSGATPSGDQLKKIEHALKGMPAYDRLRRCVNERSLVLMNLLAERQRPSLHEDVLRHIARLPTAEKLLETNCEWELCATGKGMSVIMVGQDEDTASVVDGIKEAVRCGKLPANQLPKRILCLDAEKALDSLLPSSKDVGKPNGLLAVVKGLESLDKVESCLEHLLLPSDDATSLSSGCSDGEYRGLPLVIVQIREADMSNEDRKTMKKRVTTLAGRLHCPVVKVVCPASDTAFISYAASAIVLLRSVVDRHYTALVDDENVQQDIRIALCTLADDKMHVAQLLSPFLSAQFCWKAPASSARKDSFRCLLCLENRARVLEISLYSTMNPNIVLQTAHHGYIVCHSPVRPASAHLALRMLANLPTVVPRVVLVGTHGSDLPDKAELELLDHTDRVAMSVGALTILGTPDYSKNDAPFRYFLQCVWEKREDVPEPAAPLPKGRNSAFILVEMQNGDNKIHTPDLNDIRHRRSRPEAYSLVGAPDLRAKSQENLLEAVHSSSGDRLPLRRSVTPETLRRGASPSLAAARKNTSQIFTMSGRSHIYDNVQLATGASRDQGATGGMVKSTSEDSRLRIPTRTFASALPSSCTTASNTTPEDNSRQPIARRILRSVSPRRLSVPIASLSSPKQASESQQDQSDSLPSPTESSKYFRHPPRRWTGDSKRPPVVMPKPKRRIESLDNSSIDVPHVPAPVQSSTKASNAHGLAFANNHFKRDELPPAPPLTRSTSGGPATSSKWYSPAPLLDERKTAESAGQPTTPSKSSGQTYDEVKTLLPSEATPSSSSSTSSGSEVSQISAKSPASLISSGHPTNAQSAGLNSSKSPEYSEAAAPGIASNVTRSSNRESVPPPTFRKPKLLSSPTVYEIVDSDEEVSEKPLPPPPPLPKPALNAASLNASLNPPQTPPRVQSRGATPLPSGGGGGPASSPPPPPPPKTALQQACMSALSSAAILSTSDDALAVTNPLSTELISTDELLSQLRPDSDTSTSSSDEAPPLPPRRYLVSDSGDESDDFDKIGSLERGFHGAGNGNEWNSILRLSRSRMSMHSELLSKHASKEQRKQREKQRKREEKEMREQERREKHELRQQKKKQEKVERAKKKAAHKQAKAKGNEFLKQYMVDGVGPGSSYFGIYLHDLPVRQDGSKIPLFVELCVDHIEQHGIESGGIYRVSGKKPSVDKLQEDFAKDPLNTTIDIEEMNVNVVASAMKSFFRRLPEPLIPTPILAPLAKSLSTANELEDQLQDMKVLINAGVPSTHFTLLKYLCRHLNRVAEKHEINLMLASNLSIVFWPTLMRPESLNINDFTVAQEMPLTLQRVMTLLIDKYHMIFDDNAARAFPSSPAKALEAAASPVPNPAQAADKANAVALHDETSEGESSIAPYTSVSIHLTPIASKT